MEALALPVLAAVISTTWIFVVYANAKSDRNDASAERKDSLPKRTRRKASRLTRSDR